MKLSNADFSRFSVFLALWSQKKWGYYSISADKVSKIFPTLSNEFFRANQAKIGQGLITAILKKSLLAKSTALRKLFFRTSWRTWKQIWAFTLTNHCIFFGDMRLSRIYKKSQNRRSQKLLTSASLTNFANH